MSLTSQLLGIASLVSQVSELKGVKNHLFKAGREVLLATKSILDLVDKNVSDATSQTDLQEKVQIIIRYVKRVLKMLVKKLPQADEQEYRILHKKVIGSILDVLDSEIRSNQKKKTQKSKMKAEALEAIRQVLMKEADTIADLNEEE